MSTPDKRLRVLITGFGPFPGAPHNPTEALVRALGRLKHPALHDVVLFTQIFDVAYGVIDRALPALVAQHRPHVLLMFGLAARRRGLHIETRAINRISALMADTQAQRGIHRRAISPASPFAHTFGAHNLRLHAALRRASIEATLSRDAGRYVCNYLSWRALELMRERAHQGAPLVCSFIHIPTIASRADAIALDHASSSILVYLVREARRINQIRAAEN